jgi:acetolactate synthase-1/2/3 large subunit
MSFPTLKINEGQRLFTNAGSASMGYDLPAALGAAIAAPERTTVCLAGDGSIMMNIQELQTVAHYRPNLKIIVINNDGYLSIRSTQAGFFNRVYGASSNTGVTVPDFQKVAAAFNLPAAKLANPKEINDGLNAFFSQEGPALLEVLVDPDQPFEPKLSSRKLADGKMVSAPLEDMWPFLEREEFMENMIVKPLF